MDEFICLTKKTDLKNFLIDYEKHPALAVHWVMFDSNGYINKPEGNVLELYTRVHKNYIKEPINSHIKCIVNPLLHYELFGKEEGRSIG